MGRLGDEVYAELDDRLGALDASLRRWYPGDARTRQPIHTVYVPGDRWHGDLVPRWGANALGALRDHAPLPFAENLRARVEAKLANEPIEDLRIDFEDGYGNRDDSEEDGHVRAAAHAVIEAIASDTAPPFLGVRCKSLEERTRRRAIRTLDLFLDELGPPPNGFVITLPKVSDAAQVEAMVVLCGRLERAYGLPGNSLRFELQIETPAAVLAADGTVTVARLIHAAAGRCAGLHYGTYDYSAACGIAAAYQSMAHPAADHAKAVMQVAAAGTGVRLSDGSTNILPVGDTEAVHAAWQLHATLVRRSLERGFYQGWDLHPAQLPTRYAATYAFFRDGLTTARERLTAYLDRRDSDVLDEPATARALAGFLLRGLQCGAFDEAEAGFTATMLVEL
jgi:citrate lyase beta subunit